MTPVARRCVRPDALLFCREGCEAASVETCPRRGDPVRYGPVPTEFMPRCTVCGDPVFCGGDVHKRCRPPIGVIQGLTA